MRQDDKQQDRNEEVREIGAINKEVRKVGAGAAAGGGLQACGATGRVVTNGMSEYARDKENANAAVLVNVDGRDFGSAHPLAGMEFQERLEKTAFALGGGNYFAPAQTVGDFLNGRKTEKFGRVRPSYKPGVAPADFRRLFDKPLYEALQEGIRQMDKKLHGFAAADAVLTAVESRSSSPVRLIRGADFMSNIGGVYPIGEGAGYAGGITSAAADGVRLAAVEQQNQPQGALAKMKALVRKAVDCCIE